MDWQRQQSLDRLAASLVRCHSISDVLTCTASACTRNFANLHHVSCAFLFPGTSTLLYFQLYDTTQHQLLGLLPVAGTAAGRCMQLQQPVSTGHLPSRGYQYLDWRHFLTRDHALSVACGPLAVAGVMLGSLCVTSLVSHAFEGCEATLIDIANLIAPYIQIHGFDAAGQGRQEMQAASQQEPRWSSAALAPSGASAAVLSPQGFRQHLSLKFKSQHTEAIFLSWRASGWQTQVDLFTNLVAVLMLLARFLWLLRNNKLDLKSSSPVVCMLPFPVILLWLAATKNTVCLEHREWFMAGSRVAGTAWYAAYVAAIGARPEMAPQSLLELVMSSTWSHVLTLQAFTCQVLLHNHVKLQTFNASIMIVSLLMGSSTTEGTVRRVLFVNIALGWLLPTVALYIQESTIRSVFVQMRDFKRS